jgi:hypothetical protein
MTLDSETDLNAGKGVFYDNNRIETFYVGAEADGRRKPVYV